MGINPRLGSLRRLLLLGAVAASNGFQSIARLHTTSSQAYIDSLAALTPAGGSRLARPLRQLHAGTGSRSTGRLEVGSLPHSLYYEVHGSTDPCAPVALFLHGGPGAGCFSRHACFFAPDMWRVVLVDQRGCGGSVPADKTVESVLRENTLAHLVADCEALRTHLAVDRWALVLGGSWGTTLALGYAQAHPHAVRSMVLRGMCTMRRSEVLWMFGAHGGAAGKLHSAGKAAAAIGLRLRRSRAESFECTAQEKRTEIVTALFAVLRAIYAEQYEHKQLDGTALSVCMEALSSGEEYLAEHPLAVARAAFELELDVLLYELPEPSPWWVKQLLRIPALGRQVWRNQLFRRTYEVTESLAAFVHAHAELEHLCASDERKVAVVREAVLPVVARARARLHEHRLRYWSLTTLQINLLTARAAIDMKRHHVKALASSGDLTSTDVGQLTGALDSALYAVDTMRFSVFAPRRFHRKLRAVLRQLDFGTMQRSAKGNPAAAGADGCVYVWADLPTGTPRHAAALAPPHEAGAATCVAWSAQGSLLASTHADGSVVAWE
jgi:pimeloyl-ACP methyl ester carboxylesterase